MLDQEDRQAEFLLDPADHFHEFLRLLRVHARRRLVQEEELGLRGQRPRDFEASLCAVGQVLREFMRVLFEVEDGEQLHRLLFYFALFLEIPAKAQDGFGDRVLRARMVGDLDVFEDAELGEEADVLEGAGDAARRDLAGFLAEDALAVEGKLAFGRAVDARDHVERRRLSSAVWPDQPDQLALLDDHVEVRDGAQTAEDLREAFRFQ